MKIICDIIVKGKMDLFINMGCFMNKSKLKFLIGGVLTLNFLIYAEKSFAAIRRTFYGGRGGQNPSTSSLSSASTGRLTRPVEVRARPIGPQAPRTTFATLSDEEIRVGLDSAKALLNKGEYKMVPRLKDTLDFMNHSSEDFEKAFNSLIYNDYYKTRYNKQHNSRIYVFDKNDPKKGNLYMKFSLTKELKDLNIISYNNDEIVHEETKHIPTVSTLVNDSSFTKLDLVGRSADKALSIIKDRVENHEYFKAHRVNESLKELRYMRKEFRNIVSKLEKKHYISGPDPVHQGTDRGDGSVWVFGYNDEVRGNELYIKFLIGKNENELRVLSFHKTDRPLNFFFKELQ